MDLQFPKIFRLRQKFPGPRIDDIDATVIQQLNRLQLQNQVLPGESVAISAGSRGIANIVKILRATVAYFKELGANPFLVPAMGSHGGGTAEGQQRVLESYGISESACGCPIRASMDTVVIGEAAEGFPVHFDRYARQADHVLVCGRVKPHTKFQGDIQSGLMKMMLLGLGKHAGAKIYHRAIDDFGFPQIIRSVASEVLNKGCVVAGLAIVENGYDETALIEAVAPANFESREVELLRLASQWMAKLPFSTADILLIDHIGKDISGTGMDTNVIGRKPPGPDNVDTNEVHVRHVVVRDLTPSTHGNAVGIGLAELCRTKVVEKMDRHATMMNCVTSGHLEAGRTPLYFDTDREILETSLQSMGLTRPTNAKLMWVPNTLSLTEVECSAAYLDEANERDEIEILRQPINLPLDRNDQLPVMSELVPNDAAHWTIR